MPIGRDPYPTEMPPGQMPYDWQQKIAAGQAAQKCSLNGDPAANVPSALDHINGRIDYIFDRLGMLEHRFESVLRPSIPPDHKALPRPEVPLTSAVHSQLIAIVNKLEALGDSIERLAERSTL